MSQKNLIFIVVVLISLVVDQTTKFWIYENVAYRTENIVVISGFFDLVHAQNPGAAFGFLRGSPYRLYIFLFFTVVAGGVILDLFRRLPKDDKFLTFVLALIFSGAIGNAIDRVHKGSVTDFLRIYTDHATLKPWLIERFGTNEWPSFNVADSALVVGVILFMIHYLFLEEAEVPAEESEKAGA